MVHAAREWLTVTWGALARLGTEGSDSDEARSIAASNRFYVLAVIANVPCFVDKTSSGDPEHGRLENLIALVDSKLLVFATRRALMQEALARGGPTPSACVERLGWKADEVDWNAPLVIVRKYDPSSTQDPISPVVPARDDVGPKTRCRRRLGGRRCVRADLLGPGHFVRLNPDDGARRALDLPTPAERQDQRLSFDAVPFHVQAAAVGEVHQLRVGMPRPD